MFFDSFLLAFILPAYPVSSISETPELLEIAAEQEYTNPYNCIKTSQKYLSQQQPKDVIKNLKDGADAVKQYSDSWLIAKNIEFSCTISLGQYTEFADKELLNKHLHDTDDNTIKNFQAYNIVRNDFIRKNYVKNSIYEAPEYKFFTQTSTNDAWHESINTIIRISNLVQNDNIIEALQTFNKSVSSSAFKEVPPDVKAAILLEGVYIMLKGGENEKAISTLKQILNILKEPQYSYSKAVISKKASKVFYKFGYLNDAMTLLKDYLGTAEKIPALSYEYLDSLKDFVKYSIELGDLDQAYMVLQKAKVLVKTNKLERTPTEAKILKLISFIQSKRHNHAVAKRLITQACAILNNSGRQQENQHEIINCNLDKLSIMAEADNYNEIKQVIQDLEEVQPLMTEKQKTQFIYAQGIVEAHQKNYKEAFELLKSIRSPQVTLYSNNIKNDSADDNKGNEKEVKKGFEEKISSFNDSYFIYSSAAILLIILAMSLALLNLNRKNSTLKKKLDFFNADSNSRAVIYDDRSFLSYITQLRMDFMNQSTASKMIVPEDKYIFILSVPGLKSLNILRGNEFSYQIQRLFIQALNTSFSDSKIFRISESEFIIVNKVISENTTQKTIELVTGEIEKIINELRLKNNYFSCIIQYPFLPNYPFSVPASKILEILLAGLSGAYEIGKQTSKSAWVNLRSNMMDKNIYVGDARQCTFDGIIKGAIHVRTSDQSVNINWQQISERNNY